jgi:hypothetical protein
MKVSNFRLTVVKYDKLAGIGDHIIYALNRLYIKKKNEIIFFDFNNFFYTNQKNKNLWEEFFFQPFYCYKNIIKKKMQSNDFVLEYNREVKNHLSYTSKNGKNNLQNYKKIKRLRKIFTKYIKFKPQILKESRSFCQKNMKKKTLSIHIRGTDKFRIHSIGTDFIKEFQSKIIERIKKYKNKKKINKIFLATDDFNIRSLMKKNFADCLIKKKINLNKNIEALHLASIFESESIKLKNCKIALIDMILLSKCDESLLCQSNLSIVSILMRDNNKYDFLDSDIEYS